MQILANKISQSAVQMSATKADNSPKADAAFAEYLDQASLTANNSQNTDNTNSEYSPINAENLDNSETQIVDENKSNLLSEIALFFVNNNTGNLNNITQNPNLLPNSDAIVVPPGQESQSAINDLMQKIQNLIKQAEETKTDDEAESVNHKLRQFVLNNSNIGINGTSNSNINDSEHSTDNFSDINLAKITNNDNYLDPTSNLGYNNGTTIERDTIEISNTNNTSNTDISTTEELNKITQIADKNITKISKDTAASLNNIDADMSQTIGINSEKSNISDTKATNNNSASIETINNSHNLDKLTLSEQVQNINNSNSTNNIKSIDTELSTTVNQSNNNLLNTANNKTSNVNQEHLESQTSTPSGTNESTDDGFASTPTSTGATKDGSGNQTGQENRQDNTQRNIIFEPTAQHKEENAITGIKTESTFAEYDKKGNLRIDDIPRYINRVIAGMPDNGTHQTTINLSPASLGKVSIEISLNGNIASIKFKAEGIDAVKSIESQLSNLKDNLAKNGIKIESVGVEQKNMDFNHSDNKGHQNPEGGNSQQNQERIKKDYLDYLRRDNAEKLANIELSNSESLPIRGESQSNNNSLERYI